MKPIPKLPKIAPVSIEDIGNVEVYLKEAIRDEVESRAKRRHHLQRSFICSCAVEWQSEDARVLERIARFDLVYADGEFIESEAVSSGQKDVQAAIAHIFDRAIVSTIEGNGDWPIETLPVVMAEHITSWCTSTVLWDGYGTLFFVLMSNSAKSCSDLEADIITQVRESLMREELFHDCRENDSEWIEQHPSYVGWARIRQW